MLNFDQMHFNMEIYPVEPSKSFIQVKWKELSYNKSMTIVFVAARALRLSTFVNNWV